jgi:cation diffusion facilitator family transporter
MRTHRPPTLGVRQFALLSVVAALLTIGLKLGAYRATGSVGLLSDALESVVNLVAALVALAALSVAFRPHDDDHAYGHEKVEYFASGFEGMLIIVAAYQIAVAAIDRLFNPVPITNVWLGLAIAAVASAINLGVARILQRASRALHSITLEADAQHLMADVVTSVGVIVGVALVSITGVYLLDPLIALAVAANVVITGVRLMRRSALGLMDTALPAAERALVDAILDRYRAQGVAFHAVRTRSSGPRRFISLHVLVPGEWSVAQGHALLEQIEAEIDAVVPRATTFTHLEPIDDPLSFADTALERDRAGRYQQEK